MSILLSKNKLIAPWPGVENSKVFNDIVEIGESWRNFCDTLTQEGLVAIEKELGEKCSKK